MKFFKKWNTKKTIKLATIISGFIFIVFISFYNAKFDFANMDWYEWAANSSILVGIMIFGILMGTSTGTDLQKEKVGGLFQEKCALYNDTYATIEAIKIYFSQFWIQYKERKLIEKKINFLIDEQFDGKVAKAIVHNIEKEDCVAGKLLYEGNEKIYVKNDVKFKRLPEDRLEIVKKIFDIKLDTCADSYYLSLYDDGDDKINEAELGKKIAEKISRDKRNSFIIKIVSSLVISIVMSAITIYDFTEGSGDAGRKKAWMNLLSRLSALITSFVSGYSTSVINVRDQARAIENKSNILKEFRTCYDNGSFVPETYEQMLEREFMEDNNLKKEEDNL